MFWNRANIFSWSISLFAHDRISHFHESLAFSTYVLMPYPSSLFFFKLYLSYLSIFSSVVYFCDLTTDTHTHTHTHRSHSAVVRWADPFYRVCQDSESPKLSHSVSLFLDPSFPLSHSLLLEHNRSPTMHWFGRPLSPPHVTIHSKREIQMDKSREWKSPGYWNKWWIVEPNTQREWKRRQSLNTRGGERQRKRERN